MSSIELGFSDGYHSIAFADGLEPASRRPFSIAAPSALQTQEAAVPTADPALAEIRTGRLTDVAT